MKRTLSIFALLISMSAFGQGQLQKETSGFIQFTSSKVIQLAEAVPEDKYSWAPEGARTFGEVLTHLASSNYFFVEKLGAKIPEGVSIEAIGQLKSKSEIIKALKESYDLIGSTITGTPDGALATKVEFPFPGEFTNMSSILILMGHSNEHLGQLIAYARMNGIAAPWSQGQE